MPPSQKKAAKAAAKRTREEAEAESPEASDASLSSETSEEEQEEVEQAPRPRGPAAKKARRQEAKDMGRYINKQRTLVFSSRGVTNRDRHLMNDLFDLLPHAKKDMKLDTKVKLQEVVNEVCEMKNCNNCIFFEARKRKDLYMWMSRAPSGPSIKFCVENVHTLEEVKLTGNCLKGSRPLLHFDAAFDGSESLRLTRELITQVLGTPKGHPKAMPFVDHVYSFFVINGRIWFRNYQVVYDVDEKQDKGGRPEDPVLVEIGPRFVLNPIRIFGGSFGGPTLWSNPDYVSPNEVRAALLKGKATRYVDRVTAEQRLAQKKEESRLEPDECDTEVVFK